jgi:hypothetical protein
MDEQSCEGENMMGATMFWSGLIAALVGLVCFILLCDVTTKARTAIEDACAFVLFAGLIIAVIGAVLWIGRWLG